VPQNISARFWFSRAGIHAGGFVFLAIARHGIVFPLVTSVESISCSVARAHKFVCCRWLVLGPCAAGPIFGFFILQEHVDRFGVQQERALAACVSF
jgi:hypothetical protein